MLILSVLNAFLFNFTYQRTNFIAQIILRVFVFSSGLLLVSAAWRMWLYVYYYGLSYEKFFASYTTLFALFVFTFLVKAACTKATQNVIKVIVFSALWFYAVATVLPIEKIIFHTNVSLSTKPNSRINLAHLQALSADVLADVYQQSTLQNPQGHIFAQPDWSKWITKTKELDCGRTWYQTNLSMLANCSLVGE